MSTLDSKPGRTTLGKPVKPRAVAVPTPLAARPGPGVNTVPVRRGQATPYRPGPASPVAAVPVAEPSTKKPRFRKPRKEPVVEVAMVETGERLSKRVMQIKGCSRKEAEQYIEGGFVTVNGVVVEEPAHRVDQQTVALDPQASLLLLNSVTLILNKPPGTTDGLEELDDDEPDPRPAPPRSGPGAARSTRKGPPPNARSLLTPQNHWEHDPSGIRTLKRHFNDLEADVELETGASGLVVFTQDWRVARKLREDSATLEHEVVVDVTGEVKPGGLERLNRIDHGFTLNGVLLSPAKVSFQSEARLRFALKNEKPGQIAFMCESVGLQVTAMKRLRIGRVPLSDLPVGQWRYLMPHERF